MTEFYPEKATSRPSKRAYLAGRSKIPVAPDAKMRLRTARPWHDPLEDGDPEWAERKRIWKSALQPYVDRFTRNDGLSQRGEW
ncbi:hypothetical protein [Ensifer sp. MJa1]|uniref:hypothetical protein n=1 Tax=Ensifer sp. MJa1 TaxID=2919888 RepID=UPI00300951D9